MSTFYNIIVQLFIRLTDLNIYSEKVLITELNFIIPQVWNSRGHHNTLHWFILYSIKGRTFKKHLREKTKQWQDRQNSKNIEETWQACVNNHNRWMSIWSKCLRFVLLYSLIVLYIIIYYYILSYIIVYNYVLLYISIWYYMLLHILVYHNVLYCDIIHYYISLYIVIYYYVYL